MNYIITEVAELEEFPLANLWSSFDKQKYFSMTFFFSFSKYLWFSLSGSERAREKERDLSLFVPSLLAGSFFTKQMNLPFVLYCRWII